MNSLTTNHQSLKINQEGFSLIEIIISIAVIGVMVAMVGVLPGGFLRGSDVDSVANIMISDIRTMQAKSVAGVDGNGDETSDRWGVCFRESNASYDLVYLSSPTATDPCSASVKDTVFLQGGVTFSEPITETEAVYFEKISGESSSDENITVTVTKGGISRTITITPSGLVY